MANSLVRFVQVIYRACWTIVVADNFIILSMELPMPKQYLGFLSLMSCNGRWRHRCLKLANFSTILQQNKEIFPCVHLYRMLGEYLNYNLTYLPKEQLQWHINCLNTGSNPIHFAVGMGAPHCTNVAHVIAVDLPGVYQATLRG